MMCGVWHVQEYYRGWKARMRFRQLAVEIAAIEAQERILQFDAVLKIQCAYRIVRAHRLLAALQKAKHDAILARIRAREGLAPAASSQQQQQQQQQQSTVSSPAPAVVSQTSTSAAAAATAALLPPSKACCAIL